MRSWKRYLHGEGEEEGRVIGAAISIGAGPFGGVRGMRAISNPDRTVLTASVPLGVGAL